MAKRKRFGPRPGHVYVGSANVSTKPISGKYSYTLHRDHEKAKAEAEASVRSRLKGYHTRRLYRVNVFLKDSVLQQAGLL